MLAMCTSDASLDISKCAAFYCFRDVIHIFSVKMCYDVPRP